jgi:predicted alpha/beta-hydrolase family hydrolase
VTEVELLVDGGAGAGATVVLAHGAGAPMDGAPLAQVAPVLAAHGLRVVRFEFPYMAARRRGGGRRAPDRESVLRATWLEVIAQLGGGRRLVIGGRSMGGRIASLVADEVGARGLVCLSYPFHPPGRPDRPRIAHLANLRTPALFVQGERDPFGSSEEVGAYPLAPGIRMRWLPDADHALRPRARSGFTAAQHLGSAVEAVVEFVRTLPR